MFQGRVFVNLQIQECTSPTAQGKSANLSQRESEVLGLLAHGHTNQEIADRLLLSVKTIETYRARITDKLGLRTRAEFVRYALEIGLLGPETAGPA